jgi:hypothetical protein
MASAGAAAVAGVTLALSGSRRLESFVNGPSVDEQNGAGRRRAQLSHRSGPLLIYMGFRRQISQIEVRVGRQAASRGSMPRAGLRAGRHEALSLNRSRAARRDH